MLEQKNRQTYAFKGWTDEYISIAYIVKAFGYTGVQMHYNHIKYVFLIVSRHFYESARKFFKSVETYYKNYLPSSLKKTTQNVFFFLKLYKMSV